MIRHSLYDLPIAGTEVIISPIKHLTLSQIQLDREHCYFDKHAKGVVVSNEDYEADKLSKSFGLKLEHVVPVKLETGEVIIVHPDFLVSELNDKTMKKKERRTVHALVEQITDRINELINHSI